VAERTEEFKQEARRKLEAMHATEFEARGDHDLNLDVNLMAGDFYGNGPHDGFTWLRANAPVYHDPKSDVWGIAKHADIIEASRTPEVFSNSQNIRPKTGPVPMMISMDDPDHKKRRKNVARGFLPKRVEQYEDHVRAIVNHLLDRVVERGECDFVWDVAAWVPLIVIGDMLGVAEGDRKKLLEWSDLLLKGTTGDLDALGEATQAFGEYWAYQGAVVADRKVAPTDDLVSILTQADVDGDLLDDESIIWESLLILIGGDETTRHVISGGLHQLLVNPPQFDELRADTSRQKLPRAIEEMLRWVSPIQSMSRHVMRDVDFHGQQLRQGDEVLLLYPSANRDEAVFDDPFTFDIHRSPNDHVAFGNGPHFCLGSHVAKLELRMLFDEVFNRMPDIALAPSADKLEYRASSFVSGLEGLPVTFTPGAPLAAWPPAVQ